MGAALVPRLSGRLVPQAHGLDEAEKRPGGSENDHCEKSELGDDAWPLVLSVSFAQEAESAQTKGKIRFGQPTVGGIAA